MGILEGLVSGFAQAISFEVLPYLIVGSIFGMIIGIIPGLSGHFAMAMLIPFLYKMDPAPGIAFLLAAHATVAQGGGLTAIFLARQELDRMRQRCLMAHRCVSKARRGCCWCCHDGLFPWRNLWGSCAGAIAASVADRCAVFWPTGNLCFCHFSH